MTTITMKQTLRITLLALAAASITAPVLAQDGPPPTRGMRHNSPEAQAKMLDHMTKTLNLTPDQVTQIRAIQTDETTKMSALNAGSGPARGEHRQMKDIRKDEMSRTRGVLNEDQKAKFDAMMEKMKEKREEKKEDGAKPPATN